MASKVDKVAYRMLAPHASVRVSPIQLGCMTFGVQMHERTGDMTKGEAFAIMDMAYEAGVNFFDTACSYQSSEQSEGESEIWVGEWMKERGVRDEIVIATKYTSLWKRSPIRANFTGNNLKSMYTAVHGSLKKLQTHYIDVLYMHWFDGHTDVEEVMRGLHTLVTQGKVLYLAISDTPAWWVVKANCFARANGLTPFVLYQGKYSLLDRDMERDIFPMCKDQGMGIALWNVLGGGQFKTAEQIADMEKRGETGRNVTYTEESKKVTAALEKVAKAKGCSITGLAMAYAMRKAPYIYPIVGVRKVSHLKDNIAALKVRLSDEDVAELEASSDFSLGFPHDFLSMPFLYGLPGHDFEFVEPPKSLHAA